MTRLADVPKDHPPTRIASSGWWLVLFVAALLLYGLTSNRGPQWQDSGWQQVRIVSGELAHPLGLALTHPLQFWLGRAAVAIATPLGIEPACAITLISSLAGAVAVANVGAVVMLLTRQPAAGVVSAAALGLAHTVWMFATHTESYALVIAILTTEWLCIAAFLRQRDARWLVVLAAVNGLGVSNHLLAGLATPVNAGFIIWAWRRRALPGRWLPVAGGLWVLGTLLYTIPVIATMTASGDIAGTLRSALVGEFADEVANTSLRARDLVMGLGYVGYNLPNLALPLALFGLWSGCRSARSLVMLIRLELIIYGAFVFRYSIADQFTFFLPVYAILAVFAGFGVMAITERLRGGWRRLLIFAAIATILLNPVTYLVTTNVLRQRGMLAGLVRNKPYRDGHAALFIPWGAGANYAERVLTESLRLAGDNGLILIEDGMVRFPFEYADALGRIAPHVTLEIAPASTTGDRRDELIDLALAATANGRPVVLVPSDRDQTKQWGPMLEWLRVGDIYLLDEVRPTPP